MSETSKDKLSSSNERFIVTEYKGKRNAQDDLIDKAKKASRN
jgi:hypothetical protein